MKSSWPHMANAEKDKRSSRSVGEMNGTKKQCDRTRVKPKEKRPTTSVWNEDNKQGAK